MLREMMADRVDGIDLVLPVKIRVEGVHHHHEFLPLRVFISTEKSRSCGVDMIGMASRVRVDDEGAVHPLMDMALQRQRMAVVEVTAERLRVELVDELT